jgi:membrane protein
MLNSIKTRIIDGWEIVSEIIRRVTEHEIAVRAGSLAYYGLFSIFPLLLFLIYIGSVLLTTETVRNALPLFLNQLIPLSTENVETIIDQTVKARGPIGILSAIGLLWTASSVFGVLEMSLSVIWNGKPRTFWQRRVLAASTVLVLSILFIGAFTLGPVASWLWTTDDYSAWLNFATGFGLISVTCFLMFRIFPNRDVSWQPALAGAVLSGGLIEIAKSIFDWYLTSAFANYGYIYGSIAWIVALCIWTYVVSALFFLGAEFGAVLDDRREVW